MMERDCYGEAKAASELTKRERFFLVYELIQKTLIDWRRLNLNSEKLFKKINLLICKFLAYENKNLFK